VTSVFQALLKKVWLDFYQLLNSDYWWSQLSSFCKDKAWNECWSLCSGNYVADWPMQRPFWSWKACLCGCMHTDAPIAASYFLVQWCCIFYLGALELQAELLEAVFHRFFGCFSDNAGETNACM
jgi:hypothetical protein